MGKSFQGGLNSITICLRKNRIRVDKKLHICTRDAMGEPQGLFGQDMFPFSGNLNFFLAENGNDKI